MRKTVSCLYMPTYGRPRAGVTQKGQARHSRATARPVARRPRGHRRVTPPSPRHHSVPTPPPPHGSHHPNGDAAHRHPRVPPPPQTHAPPGLPPVKVTQCLGLRSAPAPGGRGDASRWGRGSAAPRPGPLLQGWGPGLIPPPCQECFGCRPGPNPRPKASSCPGVGALVVICSCLKTSS